MKGNRVLISVTGAVLLGALATGAASSAQDKYTVKVPDGLEFSDFRGYEDWQSVAVSVTGHDTLAARDDFFSYRRNTLKGVRDYGRGLSAIALRA